MLYLAVTYNGNTRLKAIHSKIILVFFIFNSFLFGQYNSDTGLQRLSTMPLQERIKVLQETAEYYSKNNALKSIEYCNQIIELTQQIKDIAGKKAALILLVDNYIKTGNLKKAKEYSDILFDAYILSNDERNTPVALNLIAKVQAYQTDYENSIQNYYKAIELSEKYNNQIELAKAMNGQGIVFYILGNYNKAKENFDKAYSIFVSLGDKTGIAEVQEHRGIYSLKLQKYEEALSFFKETLRIREQQKDKYNIVGTQNNIALVYMYVDKLNEALEIYQSNIPIYQELNNKTGYTVCIARIGSILRDLGRTKEALQAYLKAYETGKEMDDKRGVLVNLNNISKLYADKLNDFQNAYKYLELFLNIKDSINKEESLRKITELSEKYESEKKEKIIQDQKRMNFFLIVGIILLVIFSIITVRAYIDKKKTNRLLQEKNNFITHQQDELTKINASLKNVISTKDKLFSIISHDLRGNIGILKSTLEVLVESKDILSKDEYDSFLSGLKKTSFTTYELLENLLTWSLSEEGILKFDAHANNIYEIIEENYSLLLSRAQEKSIKLINNIDKELNGFFDRQMISTVLRNLISNSIKFTGQNGSIEVNSIQNNKTINLIIKDTGIGMTAEEVSKLFNKDEKLIKKGTNNEKGTGLGLILCKEFIEKNGGSISVESELGKGTSFILSLPEII